MPRSKPAPPPRATSPAVHALRRVAAWTLGLVLLASTAGALGIALFPTVTSGSAMAVLSGSMSPEYPVGAMVFTRAVDPADVEVGDIITFQRPSNPAELVTHRVVAVDTSTGSPVFSTKGDANDANDLDPVPASAVQGRLWFGVPQLGRIASILHSPQGLGLMVLLICGVVALAPGKPGPATSVEEPAEEGNRDRSAPRASRGGDSVDAESTEALDLGEIRVGALPAVPRATPRSLPPVPPPTRRRAPVDAA